MFFCFIHTTCSSKHAGRRGAAIIELAVCLPILLMILLATVESCVMLQLKQNLAITAYEGARIGILPGSSSEAVSLQCQMLIDDRGIEACTVSIDPEAISTMNVGDPLTVTLTADCGANSVFGGIFYDDKSITETVVMLTE